MALIRFTDNLRRHLECPPSDSAAASVAGALADAFAANPALRSYLLDDQGRLRRHVVIFLNGRPIADRASLSDAVGPDDEIFVFQALSGG